MLKQTEGKRRRLAGLLAAAVAVPALASPAAAQMREWDGRGFVSINGGLQALAAEFTDDVVFAESGGVYSARPVGLLSRAAAQEEARFSGVHSPASAPSLDAGAGYRVTGNFALGAAVSFAAAEGTAAVSARAPHPFFDNRDRELTGVAPGLRRQELGIHVQAQYLVPVTESFTVTLFGGPTLINLQQDLVADVQFRQEYPYETASYDAAIAGGQSGTGIGFNAGADLAYYFSDVAGVGLLARYSRATVDLASAAGGTVGVPAGGLQVGGGLRLKF
ncbi:MAG: outer membrane beta-barrel protein [Acidobacteria bacterium]|nr:outer membrane beta-barrel protein [Acidobacteriota bacterium]